MTSASCAIPRTRIELSPTGQPFAGVTAATIAATSAGGTGVSVAGLRGRAFLPNAQVVNGLAVTIGRRTVGVQADMSNANGTFDTAFFNPAFQFSGTTVSAPGSIPAAVAVQANRQIVIAGTNSAGSTSVFGLARLNASGSLDTTFGTGGVLTTSVQRNDHAVTVGQPAVSFVAPRAGQHYEDGERVQVSPGGDSVPVRTRRSPPRPRR